jgi:ABC-2 type transport system ATP-binding protein
MPECVHSGRGGTSANLGVQEPLVAVQGISKRFGRKTAVAGVTLTVRAGEICGFVGANGSGKTTTLRMLAGILRPESGHGHVLGFDLPRDAARIRGQVGYMSQRLSLYAELSVLENLRFRAAVYGLRNPVAWAKAAIGEFNLAQWTHRPAGSLSGGWARRLQLAAAFVHSPRLVLLDEPTAGLDVAARMEVWQRVERLAAAGAAVILCTHDLPEAERCTRAAFFADGRILAVGAPAEVAADSGVAAFLVSGIHVRPLADALSTVAGVVASYRQGGQVRVVAQPGAEPHLCRVAAALGARLDPAPARLEDAVLARSMRTEEGRP